MGYLLDTSVISAFAPGRPNTDRDISGWLRSKSDQLFLPAIAIAEIEQGICKLRRIGGAARADSLTRWLDELVLLYGKRILPFDVLPARAAGQISDKAVADGHHPGFADIAIAAIAAHHRLVILTRNLRHFAGLGVPHLDPFQTTEC